MTPEQLDAWGAFLETKLGRGMTREERTILGSMHWAFPEPPTVATFAPLLEALRSTRGHRGRAA